MTPTLALESLMLHPGYDRFVERARKVMSVGLVDQADAAATEAHRILADVAVRLSDDPARGATAGELPGWLRLGLLDTLATFAAGRATTCRHNPDAGRPAPVLAAAWRPGMVVCPGCAHLLSLRHDAAADAVCDGCGHQCAGPEHGDGIYPGMVQLGPLVYQYGTCAGCRPTITASNGPLSATETAERTAPRGTDRAKPRGSRGRGRGRSSQPRSSDPMPYPTHNVSKIVGTAGREIVSAENAEFRGDARGPERGVTGQEPPSFNPPPATPKERTDT